MKQTTALLALALLAASCGELPAPAPSVHATPAKPIALEFLPTGDVVYKISGDLGFENWNFGLRVTGSGSVPEIDRIVIEHFAQGKRVHRVEHAGPTSPAFVRKLDGMELTLHNLHVMLPRALEVSRLDVELHGKGRLLVRGSVPLVVYEQKNTYRLPVSGTWFVSSGHDFGVEHRRHLSRGHFAYDFVRRDGHGRTASGPRLDQNLAFGQPVVAPAPGTVVDVRDGGPDNPTGTRGGRSESNFVEIDHGGGEVSRSVHLQKGSIRVSVGDRVQRGQVIGSVGNSGMSDEPHLHFGFQRNVRDRDGGLRQLPIPIRFSGYSIVESPGRDVSVSLGRPRKGQFVRHDPRRARGEKTGR